MYREKDDINTMKLINIASKKFKNHMRYETEKAGINDTYRPIVLLLSREDNLTQAEIASKIHLSTPSTSLTLQKMEAEGIIERKTDEEDRRQVRICLTSKGNELFKKLIELVHHVEEDVYGDISDDVQKEVNEVLKKIINRFNELGGISRENF